MKKFILVMAMTILSLATYANNAENDIDVNPSIKNYFEEAINLKVETDIVDIEVGKIYRYRITVDCDNDGEIDVSYEGNLNEDHLQAQIDHMVAAC